MNTEKDRVTTCAKCNSKLALSMEILSKGCPHCGSLKFKTSKVLSEKESNEKEIELLVEEEFSEEYTSNHIETVRLTKEGVFKVDLDKLLSESKTNDPLIALDKDGSFHIKFTDIQEEDKTNKDKEKKKK